MRNAALPPFRLATGIFVLFAAGHTRGFLSFSPPSEAGRAVLDQMKGVPFDFGGTQATWWGLYEGFGLWISVTLAISAILTWRLSRATADASLVRTIAWLLCGNQVAGIAICLTYFGPVQAAFSAALAACLAWAALSVARPRSEME